MAFPPTKCCFDFERRLGRDRTRGLQEIPYLIERQGKAVEMMQNQKQITVSVRLAEDEYKALQAAARQEYTTMSGVLRKLIHGHVKGLNGNG